MADFGTGTGDGNGGAGRHKGRVVAGDVGDDEGRDAGRRGERGEAAAFDGTDLVADKVHHADRHARGKERARYRLLVLEAEARTRRRQQRRAAARDQRDDEIIVTEAMNLRHHAAGSEIAGLVGHRMARFDDLDLAWLEPHGRSA